MQTFDIGPGIPDRPWPYNYYALTDSRQRKDLLDAQLEADPGPENKARLLLWEKRYLDEKGKSSGIDYFMRAFLDLEVMEGRGKGLFGRKSSLERAKEAFRERMALKELAEQPDCSHVWKDEFMNFFSLYIDICKKDRTYGSVLLNVGRMSEDRLADKIKADLYEKTVELPRRLGMEEDFTLLREAAAECCRYYLPK